MTVDSEQKAFSSKKSGGKNMIQKILTCLLPAVLLLTVSLAQAQQPAEKIPRIGFQTSEKINIGAYHGSYLFQSRSPKQRQ